MQLTGMRGFTVIWLGQFLSRIGSHLTSFGLAIWAFEQSGLATSLTLIGFFAWGSTIVASPFAGALVDRWDRKLTMMISDVFAVISTLIVMLLYATGNLEIWHLCLQALVVGVGDAFQWPAFSAATSTMLKKEDYIRAGGLNGFADSASTIIAPPLAAALLTVISLETIMLIDFITFLIAIIAILFVSIPAPEVSAEGKKSKSSSFRQDLTFGWRYIVSRPSLLGLQLIIFAYVMFNNFGGGRISVPMILARTDSSEFAMGVAQMAFGVGGLLGGAMLAAWGGFKHRPGGLFLGIFGQCTGYALMGLGQSIPVWALGAFFSTFSVSIALAANQSYWQSKVPPDIQGRVFATRKMIAQIAGPISVLVAGPLADRVFEPFMASGSGASLSWLVGTGPGSGMGLQMVIFGLLGAFAGLGGYLFKATRDAEKLLPDHSQAVQPIPEPPAEPVTEGSPIPVPAS